MDKNEFTAIRVEESAKLLYEAFHVIGPSYGMNWEQASPTMRKHWRHAASALLEAIEDGIV